MASIRFSYFILDIVLFRVLLVTAALSMICWAQNSRTYPFCIDDEQLERYKGDFDDSSHGLIDNLKLYVHNRPDSPLINKKTNVGKCITCGHEVIRSVNYYRIHPNQASRFVPNDGYPKVADPNKWPKWDLSDSMYQSMRQWIHIHIETERNVRGLIVQSMAGYQGMPHGEFNLEFACQDCNGFTDVEREAGKADDALALDGEAVLLPCKRRAYIHSRHPNVYVFVSETGRRQFHMHFNYLDVSCRDMKMFQLLILAVPEIDGIVSKATYFFTAAIDHNYADSVDGSPYPYHTDFHNLYQCHVPDEDLGDVPPLNLRLTPGGDKVAIRMNLDYDQCLREPFVHPGGEPDPFIETGVWNGLPLFQSNYICNKPVRSQCDFGNPAEVETTSSDCESNPGKSCLCEPCSDEDNGFTREVFPRLIRRGYMARRFHGILMIISCIASPVVSIHFARYFKETGGGCALVGWWFWIHMAFSYISNAAIVTGLVFGLNVPDRPTATGNNRRRLLKTLHNSIGVAAVVLFGLEFWLGAFRPGPFRYISIFCHSILGYLLVFFGVLAALISVACLELKLYVGGIIVITLFPWMCACGMQRYLDSNMPMVPPRRYFPIIEAVRKPLRSEFRISRFWMVGIMISGVICFVALCALAGGYNGLKLSNQCHNCIWKWEDIIVLNKNDSLVDFTEFRYFYKCNYTKDIWSDAFLLF